MADRGLMIVFEGIDRCGKSTQTKLLFEELNKTKETKLLNFPKRDTKLGKMINEFLKGKTNIDKEYLHKLFSTNRWEMKAEMEDLIYNKKTNLIIDRYCYSGIAYSMSNGLDKEWCKLSDSGLPKPDLVIYLKIDIEVAQKRADYGNEVYENSEFQTKVKNNFENDFLFNEDNVFVIDVNKKGKQEILEIILEKIKKLEKKNILEKLWN